MMIDGLNTHINHEQTKHAVSTFQAESIKTSLGAHTVASPTRRATLDLGRQDSFTQHSCYCHRQSDLLACHGSQQQSYVCAMQYSFCFAEIRSVSLRCCACTLTSRSVMQEWKAPLSPTEERPCGSCRPHFGSACSRAGRCSRPLP